MQYVGLLHLHSNMVLIKLRGYNLKPDILIQFTFQYGSNQMADNYVKRIMRKSFTFQYGSNQI